MTAPFLLDEMSEESACLAGRSTYVARSSPKSLQRMRVIIGREKGSRLDAISEPATPATAAARFNLDQVRFDVARTSPRQASHRQLQSVAQILSAFPKATVFIGYAGGVDRSKAASRIVRARLISVWRELTRMGVDSARLSVKWPNGSSTFARKPAKRLPPKNAPIFLEISMRSFS